MNTIATWVLTDTRGVFTHTFTCSICGRTVEATKHFDDTGYYDMKSSVAELMTDYPYCHCGAKMKKDNQIEDKITQMKKTHKLAVDTWLSENPIREKRCWDVDEVVGVD